MQQSLDFKTIEEITEKIIDYRGKTPPKTNKGIKLITAKVIKDGYILDGEHEYISEANYPEWMTRGFPQKGDVLITTEAPLGEVALLRTNEKIALAQRVILLRGKPNLIDQTYYMYALKTSFVQEQLRARSVSTTVAGIKQSDLVEVKIPLLPLEEQKRIASIAQKCDRLRRTRRYTQQLSDSYLRSVFLEMFGDPLTNSRGWEIEAMEEIADVQGGLQLSQKREKYELKLPYLRVANVYRNYLDLSEIKKIGLTKNEFERVRLAQKDILIIEGHGNANEIGRCAVWNGSIENCVHQNHLIRVRANPNSVNSTYLSYYINSSGGQRYFQNASNTTSGLNTISTGIVKECGVPLPPLLLQEKFAQIVQRFERLRIQQREADRQAEHLFQTVLDRAFRGEL